jgi:hypothetical protein
MMWEKEEAINNIRESGRKMNEEIIILRRLVAALVKKYGGDQKIFLENKYLEERKNKDEVEVLGIKGMEEGIELEVFSQLEVGGKK